MAWTDERVALLKKMWGDGKTAAEIAKELGEGVTRNAVIGKAHRLKLSGRASPIQSAKKTVKAASEQTNVKTKSSVKATAPAPKKPNPATSKPKAVSPAAQQSKKELEAIKNKGKRLPLSELTERMCRWPMGDPEDEDFGYCGCKSEVGMSYCEEHMQLAYQTTTRARNFRIDDFVDADVSAYNLVAK